MTWNQPRYFCQRNANARCRGCARLWQNWLHHITEPIAINAACVLMSDTYLLEAILLARIHSSTDITSEQKQNSSQHNTVSELGKGNVCQHTVIASLATIWWKHCIKMTRNTNNTNVFSPSSLFLYNRGMAHLYCTTLGKHMHYFICCCCLLCILHILIVNANADASVITAFYSALIAVLWRF